MARNIAWAKNLRSIGLRFPEHKRLAVVGRAHVEDLLPRLRRDLGRLA